MLWARSDPNPKLKEEVDSKMMRGEEELDLKDAEVDDEMNDEGEGEWATGGSKLTVG